MFLCQWELLYNVPFRTGQNSITHLEFFHRVLHLQVFTSCKRRREKPKSRRKSVPFVRPLYNKEITPKQAMVIDRGHSDITLRYQKKKKAISHLGLSLPNVLLKKSLYMFLYYNMSHTTLEYKSEAWNGSCLHIFTGHLEVVPTAEVKGT